MTILKNLAATCAIACGLTLQVANAAAEVSPIVDSFGDVSPTIKDEYVDAFRNFDPNVNTWYVTFNLLTEADVSLGVAPLDPLHGSFFNVTAIHLDQLDGTFIKGGTDTFTTNPFAPAPIEQLIASDQLPLGEHGIHLAAGQYAVGVSGTGNRVDPFSFNADVADFRVHIQVMPIPEPETYALMLVGLGLVGFMARRRQRA